MVSRTPHLSARLPHRPHMQERLAPRYLPLQPQRCQLAAAFRQKTWAAKNRSTLLGVKGAGLSNPHPQANCSLQSLAEPIRSGYCADRAR